MKSIKKFSLRWGYSTNHKNISISYLFYAALAGIIGILFFVFAKTRMVLAYYVNN